MLRASHCVRAQALTYGTWHAMMYGGLASHGALKPFKYNPLNQYEPDGVTPVGLVSSSSGNLQRDVALTTLGWLQSAFCAASTSYIIASRSGVSG